MGCDAPVVPGPASLAALRAWYEGLSARAAVSRYLSHRKLDGQSSRGLLGRIGRELAAFARSRQREDLAELFEYPAAERMHYGHAVRDAIDTLQHAPTPVPLITDDVALWFSRPIVLALKAHAISTLADLTVRVLRRRRWWAAIPRLGVTSARRIEAFFAAHAELTERARALINATATQPVAPWERLQLPEELDGSRGTFRANAAVCTLSATNDYQAVQAWLELHEAPATQRAYRKEAERLILWAILQRGRPLSSLTTDDAIAYRAFLRRPTPQGQWMGPPRPRAALEWRPFVRPLSARSIAYALSVLAAMYRWLVEQGYLLANPFAGIKVRGGRRGAQIDTSHALNDAEWATIRRIAEYLDTLYEWDELAAQRIRFILDFGYATGLRVSELVGATLGDVRVDEHGDTWLLVLGKGAHKMKVGLPPLALRAKELYLRQRGLSVAQCRSKPNTPLIARLNSTSAEGLTDARLRRIVHRFFLTASKELEASQPALAAKLRHVTPHWLRHSHATHALTNGVELTTVRDNLRHASVSTTSLYLHVDDVARAKQIGRAFG
jgi:site-specific recombinase XerD